MAEEKKSVDVIEKKGMLISQPEYYSLICCNTGKVLSIDDCPVAFEFTGQAFNKNYPDAFFNRVIGEIVTLSKIKVDGCYTLSILDGCDFDFYKIIEWSQYFFKAKIYDNCLECVGEDIIENEEEVLQRLPVIPIIDACKDIYDNYVKTMYGDALSRMEGIQICCLPNKMKSILEFERLVRKRSWEEDCCFPRCTEVLVKFKAGDNGTYSYINSLGEDVTENADFIQDTNVILNVESCKLTGTNIVTLVGNFPETEIIAMGNPC